MTYQSQEKIPIFNNNIIKILIINTKTETSIWLLITENKSFGKRFGRLDKNICQV